MELGPQNLNKDGLLGPNSIMVVYMEPLGILYLMRSSNSWIRTWGDYSGDYTVLLSGPFYSFVIGVLKSFDKRLQNLFAQLKSDTRALYHLFQLQLKGGDGY